MRTGVPEVDQCCFMSNFVRRCMLTVLCNFYVNKIMLSSGLKQLDL